MKIAYYDDNPEFLGQIKNLMKAYCDLCSDSAEAELFSDKKVFLENVSAKCYDLIFLKGVYSNAAGGEVAGKIRAFYPCAPIVFLNRIDETTVETTFCLPDHCLMNPFQQDSFFHMMNEISKSILSSQRRMGIKTVDGAFRMIPVVVL